MNRGVGLLALAIACLLFMGTGCSRHARLDMGASLERTFWGTDRGPAYYGGVIDKWTLLTPGQRRYEFTKQDFILANFEIHNALRGLGGTKVKTSRDFAYVTDKILWVLAHDPLPADRAVACEELGRLVLRLPDPEKPFEPGTAASAVRINLITRDLREIQMRVVKGENVKVSELVKTINAMADETPTHTRSARQQIRAMTAAPVANAGTKVELATAKVLPELLRRAMLVSLHSAATGDTDDPDGEPDPAEMVRTAAADVLARIGCPIARDDAVSRLSGALDPKEREPDTRRNLLRYLGAIGGAKAFEVCLDALENDLDSGVRYHAQLALVRMTGQAQRSFDAWARWLSENPDWSKTPDRTEANGAGATEDAEPASSGSTK
jgi:hypothetical protein